MLKRTRPVPSDYPLFQNLPVRRFSVGGDGEALAVHVSGSLGGERAPLLCVAGYQRNMTDFADFATQFRRSFGEDWPVVLVDLKGRGRSSDRRNKSFYVSTMDARDLVDIVAALAAPGAIFVGQGYGGQVTMALAAERPNLIVGAVLLDAGPVSDPHGLVRLRNNLKDLDGPRSEAGFRSMLRRMLAPDFPALPEPMLDQMGARTHYLDAQGRVRGLFDPHLVTMLESFEHDDVLVPQWPLFDALRATPLLLMRTQMTEQLRRDTFEEMMRRRRDVEGYIIEGQGSPALMGSPEDVEPIVAFVRRIVKRRSKSAA